MTYKLPELGNFDEYNRRARLYPALFVLLPLALAVIAWFPVGFVGGGILLSMLAWAGIGYFLANIARDAGKQKEAGLYASWGGKPTTRFLRHRGDTNPELRRHVHERIVALFPEVVLPTPDEEANNPLHADGVYDLCARRIIERTRDKEKFAILFGENCSYGFRRNLWGMKKMAVSITVVALLIAVGKLVESYLSSGAVNALALVVALVNLAFVLIWISFIQPRWIRIPAEAYAERLFTALEQI